MSAMDKNTVVFSSLPPSCDALLETLLRNRGIQGREREIFLNPSYDTHVHDPFLLTDMDRAVERILDAIKNKEKIVAYTDYDTDGIPAAVIATDFFNRIGYKNFEVYIPHRNDEGFGLHKDALRKIKESGASLLITADCGITDTNEIAYARELGLDVIVTDHHLPLKKGDEDTEDLPPAHAVINPKRANDPYPFKELCGSGVFFKLLQAVISEGNRRALFSVPKGWEKWLLDMVGIATLSDRVPLRGENRALASYGLVVLQKSRRPGVIRIFEQARVNKKNLNEDDVGFVLGPRINVASRLASPALALELLSTSAHDTARRLAAELNHLNDRRKGLVAHIMKEARARVHEAGIPPVIALGDLNWTPGVLGLAAGKLAEEFSRPVFLWGQGGENDENTLKGSCRSDGSVNIVDLMRAAEDVFVDYGGHPLSGGFSLLSKGARNLEQALNEAYKNFSSLEPSADTSEGSEHVEAELPLRYVCWNVYHTLQRLAPFGEDNPKPAFRFRGYVDTVETFGAHGEHAKVLVKDNEGVKTVQGLSFFDRAGMKEKLKPGGYVSFIAHIERNVFRGKNELRLRIVGIESE